MSPQSILAQECKACRAERATRRLVAESPHDPRFLGRFVLAPSIFATNVRKCHTNKIRAEAFARRTKRHLHYVVAQDRACAAVVREKPDLVEQKLLWLQRHDRECGDLCGVLPLCDGVPALLTDHLNRARGLLKGRRGFVTGWRHASDGAEPAGPGCTVWNQLPEVVYVHFPGAKWCIAGLAKGVYPVVPKRATWHLDAGRKSPVLAVRRRQLPLLPAFALTAHQAQGQTLEEGIIADLCYGAHSNVLAAYVALTRVTSRDGVLILRPFDAAPFQQGDTSFRALLMQHWRTHDADWDAIVQKYIRVKTCGECRAERLKSAFTPGQWRQADKAAVCKECTKAYRERGTPYCCRRCKRWQAPEAFPRKVSNYMIWQSTCLMCKEKRQCGTCQHWFVRAAFTPNGWSQQRDRTCNLCRQQLRYHDIGRRARRRLHNQQEKVRATDRCKRRQQILQDVRAEICKRQKHGGSGCAMCGAQMTERRDVCRVCAACKSATPEHAAVTYRCPTCSAPVVTTVRDGRVDNRHACGHRFTLLEGKIVATTAAPEPKNVYKCPHCKAEVPSTTRNGRIDNRRNCGHQFTVAAGDVMENVPLNTSYTYKCPLCNAEVESTARDGRIDNRRSCGHRFTVAAGNVVPNMPASTSYAYKCPLCEAEVGSTTHSGRIDNRRSCGHQFTVAAGDVVTSVPANTSYTYKCPLCEAEVESSTRDGRIDNRRSCGHQFTVAAGDVVTSVPASTSYIYECPLCEAEVESTTRDGRIDNRRTCGRRFTVTAGDVVTSVPASTSYTYKCPACKAEVESTTRDGRIDNRRTCGHRFTVAAGDVVKNAPVNTSYTYKCPFCQAEVESTTRDGRIDNRRTCGHRFTVAAGDVVKNAPVNTSYTSKCPHCTAEVESTTRDGRIDNRRTCGHRFTVAAGDVVKNAPVNTSYTYKCPHCKAEVESTTRDGRIDNLRTCGHRFTVAAGDVVAHEPASTSYTYKCPHCKAKIESTVRNGHIDNRRKCGHRFTVAAGKVKKRWKFGPGAENGEGGVGNREGSRGSGGSGGGGGGAGGRRRCGRWG